MSACAFFAFIFAVSLGAWALVALTTFYVLSTIKQFGDCWSGLMGHAKVAAQTDAEGVWCTYFVGNNNNGVFGLS